jgi:hypothetical protein
MNNDELRDLFAAISMLGLIANGDYGLAEIPIRAYKMADDMIRERIIQEDGIASIKPRR